MKWKQFFTPVRSMGPDEAHGFIMDNPSDDLTILDVRQPNEYASGHIPGAKLIPLPELENRADEIDPEKSTVVYCAIGGRSRVAAQLLAAKGFGKIINLSGGYKAWNAESAFGDQVQGLELFSGDESLENTLAVAYSLEGGLHSFYLLMASRVKNSSAKDLFGKLSDIESKHQDRIYREYESIVEKPLSKEKFVNKKVADAAEGGLTTEEYMSKFNLDWESVKDITAIAMSIEAQAMDLYQRASEKSSSPRSKTALTQLADEERTHLKELGKLMEKL